MNKEAQEWLKAASEEVIAERAKYEKGRTIHSIDLPDEIAMYGDELSQALFSAIEAHHPNSVTPQHLGVAGGTAYRIHFHIDLA